MGALFSHILDICLTIFGLLWHSEYSDTILTHILDICLTTLGIFWNYILDFVQNILTLGIFGHYFQYSHPLWTHHMFDNILTLVIFSAIFWNIPSFVIFWHHSHYSHPYCGYMFDNTWNVWLLYVWLYSHTIFNIHTHIVDICLTLSYVWLYSYTCNILILFSIFSPILWNILTIFWHYSHPYCGAVPLPPRARCLSRPYFELILQLGWFLLQN